MRGSGATGKSAKPRGRRSARRFVRRRRAAVTGPERGGGGAGARARGVTVIDAVSVARRALDLAMPGQREWGLFTLYHRAGDLALESRPQPTSAPSVTVPAGSEVDSLRRSLAEIDERLRKNDPLRT